MKIHTCLASVLLLVSPSLAQDILHYKFDTGCGTSVTNFAEASKVGPGAMVSTLANRPASSWTKGQFGGGMAGSNKSANPGNNYLRTGWNIGSYSGSFSISMWIRNKPNNNSAIAFGYLFGAVGSNFRCFTGASGKLFVAGWGGANLVNAANLTTLLNAGYVHVVLVVDDKNKQATYYINGKADTPITLTSSVSFTGTEFLVGTRGTSTSPLNFDEFLFTRRVLSAAEVTALAASPQAGAGPFGTGNPGTLTAKGRPKLGNFLFAVDIQDSQAQSYFLYVGSNACTLAGGLKLPANLGTVIPAFAGVMAFTDIDLFSTAGTLNTGKVTLGLPVPNMAALSGVTSYWQAYTVTSQGQLRGTNALAISPGH